MDEVDQKTLDAYLSARGHWRRKFLQASEPCTKCRRTSPAVARATVQAASL
jgi:hypothetical protein